MKKMKNATKGFTLIELLAVFLILSIILGIAFSGYSKYVTVNRNRAYKMAEDAMQVAASDALTDCMTSAKEDIKSFCDVHEAPTNQSESVVVSGADLVRYNYIDPIANPNNTDEYCDMDHSYVYISNKANSEEENNNDFDYEVCLRCGSRKSKECRDGVLDD